jgi:hypothetical protein
MTRVQIPAYTDRWMMGDRYGEIIRISRFRRASKGAGVRAALLTSARHSGDGVEIAVVKLDKSGKTVRVILDDCEVLAS